MNPETLNNVAYNLAQRNYHVAMGLILGAVGLVFLVVCSILAYNWFYMWKARRKAQAFRSDLKKHLKAGVIRGDE